MVSSLDQFNADNADNRLVIDYKKTDVLKVNSRRAINFLIDSIGTRLSLVSFQPPDCFTQLICLLRDQDWPLVLNFKSREHRARIGGVTGSYRIKSII